MRVIGGLTRGERVGNILHIEVEEKGQIPRERREREMLVKGGRRTSENGKSGES